MTAPTENPPPHYDVDPKTGAQTWSGSSRSEVLYWRARAELLEHALLAVIAVSTQGSVCELARVALEEAR